MGLVLAIKFRITIYNLGEKSLYKSCTKPLHLLNYYTKCI